MLDDWFVVAMGILIPITIALALGAFAPGISTMKGWFRRGSK